MAGAAEYDHFSGALLDCWDYILQYIPDPEDIDSLSKVSPRFAEMLYDIRFVEVVVPTLLNSASLSMDTLLALRSINKGTMKAVDLFLTRNRPQWLISACSLSPQRPHQLDRFRDEFFPKLLGSPLLSTFLTLEVPPGNDWLAECSTFLQNFGQRIQVISLELGDAQPITVSRLLSHLPVVTSLHLNVSGILLQVEDIEEQAIATTLPQLPELISLKLSAVPNPGFWLHHQPHLLEIFDFISESYGAQLQKLILDEPPWNTLENFLNPENVGFSNLLYLELTNSIHGTLYWQEHDFYVLSQLRIPNLRTLSVNCDSIDFGMLMLEALSNFRANLEELHLPRLRVSEDLDLNSDSHLDLFQPTLTNLKKLVVDNHWVENGPWLVFKGLLPNLEELRFQPGHHCPTHLPPVIVRPTTKPRLRLLFNIFPLLKRLVWTGARDNNVITLRRLLQ